MIPIAGPALLTSEGGLKPPTIDPAEIRPLVRFLEAAHRGERYILASSNVIVAAVIILETGKPVMATGGFLGTDRILSPAAFAEMLNSRKVRFALATPPRGALTYRPSQRYQIVSKTSWLSAPVERSVTAGSALQPGQGTVRDRAGPVDALPYHGRSALGLLLDNMELYDCSPAAGNPHSVARQEL
jgi:hypothetical protein